MVEADPKPTQALITDHKWRPKVRYGRSKPECAYMNCEQLEEAHEEGVLAGHMGIKLKRRKK